MAEVPNPCTLPAVQPQHLTMNSDKYLLSNLVKKQGEYKRFYWKSFQICMDFYLHFDNLPCSCSSSSFSVFTSRGTQEIIHGVLWRYNTSRNVWQDQKFWPGTGPGPRPGPEIWQDWDKGPGPGLVLDRDWDRDRDRDSVRNRDHDKELDKDL